MRTIALRTTRSWGPRKGLALSSMAMGSISMVVAVLEIHMDSAAVATMKPSTRVRRDAPKSKRVRAANPAMQAPLLHGKGDQEPPHEEEHVVIAVLGRHPQAGHDAQQGKGHQWHQGRNGQGQGLGHPPAGHEHRHRGHEVGRYR
jgi:hypothetical protein